MKTLTTFVLLLVIIGLLWFITRNDIPVVDEINTPVVALPSDETNIQPSPVFFECNPLIDKCV